MENFLIYKKEVKGIINIIDGLSHFKIGNKEFILTDHHKQDCCEDVYADFQMAKSYVPQIASKKQ